MAPRFLLFDLDGTLIRPGTDFAAMRDEVRQRLVRAGVPQDFAFRHILGGLDDALAHLGLQGIDAEELARLRAEAMAMIERRERAGLERAQPIAGVREALEGWRARYRLGIFTRTHPEVLRDSIAKFDLGAFDVLLSRDDGPPKPDPAQVHRALALAGVAAPDTLVVGDHVFDIQAARAASVRSFGVLTGSGTREALLAAGAEDVLPDVPALSRVLPR
ncbi:MAG TPA: HAD-IA family hydrolase [Candidatus Thermoplasmatota archaeon]|nr:HAD-IA family hydrolase [Candidatus Thermoplasmatota archaeon]